MKTQNVVVDVGRMNASDLYFVQGEKGREITFKVMNSFLEDFVNLAGYTATIHILKSDGNFTINTMEIDVAKSECYYTLTENDCACGGRGFYDLSFSKNDELIYTAHGDYIGDFRSINDDSVASVSEAYGVTFPEGFQMKLTEGDNIRIINNVISAIVREYHNGTGIDISNDIISISENVLNTISGKQDELTAGSGIDITNNVISVNGGMFSRTLLYDSGETVGNIQSHITLNDAWSNYDMLQILVFYAGGSMYSDLVCTDILTDTQERGWDYASALATYATSSCACYHLNANHKDFDVFGTNTNNIYKIYGLNF